MLRTLAILTTILITSAWGPRGHQSVNRAALQALPPDGPIFLREQADWIAHIGPIPDSWRGNSEPYSKLFEDPNHGWFKEQFAFLATIPRSRYEFVLRVHDEYLLIKDTDPERASKTNVRWTGTLPYAAIENYDRMKSAMRLYRAAVKAKPAEARLLAQDVAFYAGWLGHYTADGAMPLHNSIHHDGWVGTNPKDFTRDGGVHGRFESKFVDLIQLTAVDFVQQMSKPKILDDPFAAIIQHLDDSSTHVEEVYVLDKAGAYADPKSGGAAKLVKQQLAQAASLLRGLIYTAWMQSGQPVVARPNSGKVDPATGTAPPEGPPVPNRR